MKTPDIETLTRCLPTEPDILGRERYLNSAVLIPLVWRSGEYHLLFQKRAAHIRQGGEICFPGGRVDAEDAHFKATAIRETIEELGVRRDQIDILGRLGSVVAPIGAIIEPFVGLLHIGGIDECRIHPAEVERLFMLPVAYFVQHPPERYAVLHEIHTAYRNEEGQDVELLPAKRLGLPARYHRSWGGRRSRVLVYQTPEDVIWGMTAEMVFEFIRLISAHWPPA